MSAEEELQRLKAELRRKDDEQMDDLRDSIAVIRQEMKDGFSLVHDRLTTHRRDHEDRIRSLENSRSWMVGAAAALGAVSGWLTSHFNGQK